MCKWTVRCAMAIHSFQRQPWTPHWRDHAAPRVRPWISRCCCRLMVSESDSRCSYSVAATPCPCRHRRWGACPQNFVRAFPGMAARPRGSSSLTAAAAAFTGSLIRKGTYVRAALASEPIPFPETLSNVSNQQPSFTCHKLQPASAFG